MSDTTPPVTREIEARLREILAEEFNRIVAPERPVTAAMFASTVYAPYISAMSRAYALDRASGDVVRADILDHPEFARVVLDWWERCYHRASASSWDAGELRKELRALSAVSIPRGEVEMTIEEIAGRVKTFEGYPRFPSYMPSDVVEIHQDRIALLAIVRSIAASERVTDEMLQGVLAAEAEKYTLSAGYYCTPEDAHKIKAASLAAMRKVCAPLPPAGGWRDIATAPKDESGVLGWDGFGVVIMSWCPADEIDIEQGIADGVWHAYSMQEEQFIETPTHWQPLPAHPPKVKEG